MSSPLQSDSAELRAAQQLIDGIVGEMRDELSRLRDQAQADHESYSGVIEHQ